MTEATIGEESLERQKELIEAGRRYELLEVIRETVRSEIKDQFRYHYGTTTPEQIRDQHIRVRVFFERWDAWMEKFWYGFVAKGVRWLLVAYILLNFVTGNQVFDNFLDLLGR